MIDKKMILESGMLIRYMLGELEDNEHLEVEKLLNTDAELKAELNGLELDFENLSLENTVAPPSAIKDGLMMKISTSKIIPVENQSSNKFKFFFGIAASFAALLLASSIYLYSQLNSSEKQINTVENSNLKLKNEIDSLNESLQNKDELFATITDPDTEQYIMKGNASSPNAKVVSYVNHDIKSVIVNTERLPELDKEHDYQMWADVEGEMINMGVIPKGKKLMAMNYIDNAESLNITIEPAGGNDHPTVERLITNIYLN